MKEYVVYILYSKVHKKTYVGFTSDLINRFISHNIKGKKGWTIKYRPWEVVYVEFFKTKQSALKKEKYLKSGVGREWIKSILLQKAN